MVRGKGNLRDPQRADVTRELKRKQYTKKGTPNNVPYMLVGVRMAAPSSSLPCAGARNAGRGKSILLARK